MPPQIPYKAGVVRGSTQRQMCSEPQQDPKTGWDKEAPCTCILGSLVLSKTVSTISDVRQCGNDVVAHP